MFMTKTRPCIKQRYFSTEGNENFIRKCRHVSYSSPKHRLYVHVRTASTRRFYLLPTIYDLVRKSVYPCKPQYKGKEKQLD